MSTGYKNTTANRFAQLARMKETLFHTNDLANLWGIKDKNTLYTTLKRYVQKGLLFRVHKGFYSLKKVEEVDPYLLGVKFLNRFVYLSVETVLFEEGIIFQKPCFISLISSRSRSFSAAGHTFKSRQLKDEFLYNLAGIELKEGYYKASPERAVADLLYFNPEFYFDGRDLINWTRVKEIQIEVGYK